MENIGHKRGWFIIFSILVAALTAFFLLSLLSAAPAIERGSTEAGSVLCLNTSSTLEDLVNCIHDYMPRSFSNDDTEGFDLPTITETTQWRDLVGRMMAGECDSISLNKYDWGSDFTTTHFTDTQNGNTYCVFMETKYNTFTNTKVITRVTHGWGTFIINPHPDRELSIQIAHPFSDKDTGGEGISIFKDTNSRSFLMAGTHRDANNVTSTCQTSYTQSDVTHNVENMFQPTVEELLAFYRRLGVSFTAIQFHGMDVSSCQGVSVYLTYGSSTTPAVSDKILELKSNLVSHNPTWTVIVPGDSLSCTLHGSDNVQGRLLNGVAAGEVCTRDALIYSGKFFHVEQKTCCRNSNDWIAAINETWPCWVFLPLVLRQWPP